MSQTTATVGGQSHCSLIIAGSRSLEDRLGSLLGNRASVVRRCIRASSEFDVADVDQVLSGTASGPDTWGELFADSEGIALERMPALWDAHGKDAGFRRNESMARSADALLAIWDGESNGTADMISRAVEHGLDVTVIRMDRPAIKQALCGGI